MAEDLKNRGTIHISIPEEATDEQAEAFFDDLSELIGQWMEDHPDRGKWDPFLYSHTQACEDSDHCYGPGSNAEAAIVAKERRLQQIAERGDVLDPGEVIHLVDEHHPTTVCCDKVFFQLPRTDRLAFNPAFVTCGRT